MGPRFYFSVSLKLDGVGLPERGTGLLGDLRQIVIDGIEEALRGELNVRDPDSGQWPTIASWRSSEGNLGFRTEANEAHCRRIAEGFTATGNSDEETPMAESVASPVVFLSHAGNDNPLAERMARSLFAAGIETWYDQWEMNTGDSLRRKIEGGIDACTNFVVLLTLASIDRPWVQEEIDAGLVQMIEGKSKFMPVRSQIGVSQLSALIRSKRVHTIEDETFDEDMAVLVEHIFNVNRRPPLGPPRFTIKPIVTDDAALSPAAAALAKLFVENSEHAQYMVDPQRTLDQLRSALGLSKEALDDAIAELDDEGAIHTIDALMGTIAAGPKTTLFAKYDAHWTTWNPAADAIDLAQALMEVGEGSGINVAATAKRFGWAPRRMNPALEYLSLRRAAIFGKEMAHPWLHYFVHCTADTRRFLQSVSER